ncbi:MAG: dTDP-glucose 4,6-dehydratase [Dongiaceae bacterium]
MRLMVTGGAGFIGSALVRRLAGDGLAELLVVDALTYAGNLQSLRPVADRPGFRFVRAAVEDGPAMRRLLAEFRPDAVMHLAAESHVDRSLDGPAPFIATNIVGSFVLLEAARDYWQGLPPAQRDAFRFHQVSTDEVYGALGATGAFTEATPYRPSSPYAASKAAADHLARAWALSYGLPVLISNCSNNYGPCQFPEKLIPRAILTALDGRPIELYGSGENVRDWLHVEDHVEALWLILRRGRPGETYNVGGGNERTNRQVAEAIIEALDRLQPAPASRRGLIRLVPDRPGHDWRYAIDATKLRTELGWRPGFDFARGIEATVRWYLENRWWWEAVTSGAYRGERLGLAGAGPSPA